MAPLCPFQSIECSFGMSSALGYWPRRLDPPKTVQCRYRDKPGRFLGWDLARARVSVPSTRLFRSAGSCVKGQLA